MTGDGGGRVPAGRASRAAAFASAASYAVIAAAMTFPLVLHLAEPGWLGLARPHSRADHLNHLWNVWFLQSRGWTEAFGRTDLLFYPEGFELAFHTVDLVHVALVSLLDQWLGLGGAFNVAGLVLLVLSASAARAAILDLTRESSSAWLGGVVFAFTTWSLFHLSLHPDLMTLFPLPLAVLALRRTLDARGSATWAVGAGGALAVAGFAGLYLLATAALICAAMTLAFACSERRRDRSTWLRVLLFGASAAAFASPRLWPMVAGGELAEVVGQKLDPAAAVDLLRFVVPFGHPWLEPHLRSRHLAGPDVSILVPIVPLILAVVGLADRRRRRQTAFWASIGLVFLALTVGSRAELGGRLLAEGSLPRDLVTRWLPLPFAAFRDAKLFFLGAMLPLAIASALGASVLVGRASSRRTGAAICAGAALLTLGEVHLGRFRPADLGFSPFYRELALRPGGGALVELPFGRPESKRYLYYQTVHGRPIQEGSVSREARRSGRFVRDNALLSAWRRASDRDAASTCAELDAAEIARAARAIERTGFELVLVHSDAPESIVVSLSHLAPVHRDPDLTVYSVADLAAAPPCAPTGSRGQPM